MINHCLRCLTVRLKLRVYFRIPLPQTQITMRGKTLHCEHVMTLGNF